MIEIQRTWIPFRKIHSPISNKYGNRLEGRINFFFPRIKNMWLSSIQTPLQSIHYKSKLTQQIPGNICVNLVFYKQNFY